LHIRVWLRLSYSVCHLDSAYRDQDISGKQTLQLQSIVRDRCIHSVSMCMQGRRITFQDLHKTLS
jgi:hypothetical protein